MTPVFLALGSNIDADVNMQRAAAILRTRWPTIRFSHVYRTAPQGYERQEDFLNAVARIETEESPEEIFDALKKIERELGKKLPFRDGPRTMDLDLLLYGNSQLVTRNPPQVLEGQLVIPHPRMHERRFVLEPLCELIDPKTKHPVSGKTWAELLIGTTDQRCERTTIIL